MYQALYRKWRPRTFSEMAGQEHVLRTLRHQVASGRIAHAYLFCGSRGTGKTSAAKIMARAINCESPVDGDPCLTCPSCTALQDESSLDVFEMDAASNSRVEEIRELLEKVDYPPQFSRYKVYIIDEVHMLSNAAFNALLKTLEEPPSYMVFILATTEPQKLPATILSRCQRFDFGRLTEEQMQGRILEALPELKDAEPGALSLVARAADGSMRDAWSLLDMCLGSGEKLTEKVVREALGTSDSEFLFNFASAIARSDGAEALNMIEDLMREGRDVQVFLRDFSAHVRQVAAFKLGSSPAQEMTGTSTERYRQQSNEISMPRLLRMLELSMQAEADTRYSSSPRGVLELFALRSCRITDENDVQALSDKLEDMEHQLTALRENGVTIAVSPEKVKKSPEKPLTQAEKSQSAPVFGDSVLENGKKPADVWNAMLSRLAKEKPGAFAIMNQGRFGGYKDGLYTLLCTHDTSMSAAYMSAPEQRPYIEKLLTEEGGIPARFEAKVEVEQKASSSRQEREEEMLIETFGRDRVQIDND